jgi:hypothetical protein
MYNNTVECGDDTAQYDFCGSGWGIPATNAGLTFRNNHFIDKTGAVGCANGAVNCIFASSNVVESLSQANAHGYSSGQKFAFLPGSSNSSSGASSVSLLTAGKGENLASLAIGAFASLLNDTTYGVGYNPVSHTVLSPARVTNPRPQAPGTTWSSGAYSTSGQGVAPPQALLSTVH